MERRYDRWGDIAANVLRSFSTVSFAINVPMTRVSRIARIKEIVHLERRIDPFIKS
jgi:hypothetical protein